MLLAPCWRVIVVLAVLEQTRRSGDEPQALTGAAWLGTLQHERREKRKMQIRPSAGETRSFAEEAASVEVDRNRGNQDQKARQRGRECAMTQDDEMARLSAGGIIDERANDTSNKKKKKKKEKNRQSLANFRWTARKGDSGGESLEFLC